MERKDDYLRKIALTRTEPEGYTGKLIDVDGIRVTKHMLWHMKHKPYIVKKRGDRK